MRCLRAALGAACCAALVLGGREPAEPRPASQAGAPPALAWERPSGPPRAPPLLGEGFAREWPDDVPRAPLPGQRFEREWPDDVPRAPLPGEGFDWAWSDSLPQEPVPGNVDDEDCALQGPEGCPMASALPTLARGIDDVPHMRVPAEIDDVDCGRGSVIDLETGGLTLKVVEWHIQGHCSLRGGILHRGTSLGTISVMPGSRLRTQGTEFVGVNIFGNRSVLGFLGASFHPSPLAKRGSAITAVASRVYVTKSWFTELTAEHGSALVLKGGSAQVNNCFFDSLMADYSGGAIHAQSGAVVAVQGCFFKDTSVSGISQHEGGPKEVGMAPGGGAISLHSSLLDIVNSTFRHTCAVHKGGAILAMGDMPHVRIHNTRFENVRASPACGAGGEEARRSSSSGKGGAIAISSGVLNVVNSSFKEAYAELRGGAIWAIKTNRRTVDVMLVKVVMEGLEAERGGGFYQVGGSLFVGAGSTVVNSHSMSRNKEVEKYTDGTAHGGWIFSRDAMITVSGVQLSTTTAEGHGGAFYAEGGGLWIRRLQAKVSECTGLGGLLYGTDLIDSSGAHYLTVIINDVQARRIRADAGGAICLSARTLTDSAANFTGLSLTTTKARIGDGGALLFENLMKADLFDVRISDSHSMNNGGAIKFFNVKDATAFDVRIVGARTSESGGAIDVTGKTHLWVEGLFVSGVRAKMGGALMVRENSRVMGNNVQLVTTAARERGAALYVVSWGGVVLTGLTIKNAKAVSEGGALYLHDALVTLTDFHISGAEAPLGGAVIRAVSAHVLMEEGSLHPQEDSVANLLAFSRSSINFKNVNVTARLLGQFARFESSRSEIVLDGLNASCALHSEFVNSSTSYQCQDCDVYRGIVGISRVADDHQKCYACPSHAEGCKDRGCLCKAGFVLNNTEPGYPIALGSTRCVSCAEAKIRCPEVKCSDDLPPFILNCPNGSTGCRQVWAMPGHWRLDDSWEAAVQCTFTPACDRTEGKMCKDGYQGPMCMVCTPGRYRQSRFRDCRPCNVSAANEAIFFLTFLLVILAAVAVLLHIKKVRGLIKETTDFINEQTSYVRVKAKQVTYIAQAYSTLTELRFPANGAANAAGSVAPWVSLDVFASKHITKCRLGMNAHQAYCFSLLQIVPLTLVILFMWKKLQLEVDWLVLMAYNFMLMSMVKESLGLFLCDESAKSITGLSYLYSDYSLACSGPGYISVCALACLTLFVWCIGIPGFLWWRMYQRRHLLNPPITTPVGPAGGAAEDQVMGVFTMMMQEYSEAVQCYGMSTMLQLTRRQKKVVDAPSGCLSWTGEAARKPSEQDLQRIRNISSGSSSMRPDTRKLLKRGLRAVQERKNPQLKAYVHFYKNYTCECWYYEFIGIWGRIGYAIVMLLPASLQCLAGLLLSGSQLLILCILMPFRRRSDNYVVAACYVSMLGLFGAHTIQEHASALNFISSLCCALPALSFIWYVLKAYALPGRHEIWTAERADIMYEEEFARKRLAPRRRRQQQGIELAALRNAGLLDRAQQGVEGEQQ